jgi:DNA-binding PucR family transcriptional regulator
MEGRDRRRLMRVLEGRSAVVGPARPWTQVRSSYLRAVRTLALSARTGSTEPVDSEQHLAALIVGADPEAIDDLCAAVLAPLGDLRPATAQRLAETLRSWLLHQGRRDAVAKDLHVHAQTVRYRMGQLRELYGARLEDPRTVLELLLALERPGPVHPGSRGSGGSSSAAS